MDIRPIAVNTHRTVSNFKGHFETYKESPITIMVREASYNCYPEHIITGPKGTRRRSDFRYNFRSEESTHLALKYFSGHDDSSCRVEFLKKNINDSGVELSEQQVYFADPKENISDVIRAKANYIVYDLEPSYPDIDKEVSRTYFNGENEDYSQHYETIKQYFKRLEDADERALDKLQSGKDTSNTTVIRDFYQNRINDAKKQQKNAEECKKVYARGEKLRQEIRALFYRYNSSIKEQEQLSQDLNYIYKPLLRHDCEQKIIVCKSTIKQLERIIKEKQIKITPFFENLKKLYETKGIKVIKHI